MAVAGRQALQAARWDLVKHPTYTSGSHTEPKMTRLCTNRLTRFRIPVYNTTATGGGRRHQILFTPPSACKRHLSGNKIGFRSRFPAAHRAHELVSLQRQQQQLESSQPDTEPEPYEPLNQDQDQDDDNEHDFQSEEDDDNDNEHTSRFWNLGLLNAKWKPDSQTVSPRPDWPNVKRGDILFYQDSDGRPGAYVGNHRIVVWAGPTHDDDDFFHGFPCTTKRVKGRISASYVLKSPDGMSFLPMHSLYRLRVERMQKVLIGKRFGRLSLTEDSLKDVEQVWRNSKSRFRYKLHAGNRTWLPIGAGTAVGSRAIKATLDEYRRGKRDIPRDMSFIGPPGSGKLQAAQEIARILYKQGRVDSPDVLEYDMISMISESWAAGGSMGGAMRELLVQARRRVLFLRDAEMVTPGTVSTGISALLSDISVYRELLCAEHWHHFSVLIIAAEMPKKPLSLLDDLLTEFFMERFSAKFVFMSLEEQFVTPCLAHLRDALAERGLDMDLEPLTTRTASENRYLASCRLQTISRLVGEQHSDRHFWHMMHRFAGRLLLRHNFEHIKQSKSDSSRVSVTYEALCRHVRFEYYKVLSQSRWIGTGQHQQWNGDVCRIEATPLASGSDRSTLSRTWTVQPLKKVEDQWGPPTKDENPDQSEIEPGAGHDSLLVQNLAEELEYEGDLLSELSRESTALESEAEQESNIDHVLGLQAPMELPSEREQETDTNSASGLEAPSEPESEAERRSDIAQASGLAAQASPGVEPTLTLESNTERQAKMSGPEVDGDRTMQAFLDQIKILNDRLSRLEGFSATLKALPEDSKKSEPESTESPREPITPQPQPMEPQLESTEPQLQSAGPRQPEPTEPQLRLLETTAPVGPTEPQLQPEPTEPQPESAKPQWASSKFPSQARKKAAEAAETKSLSRSQRKAQRQFQLRPRW
ncbi:hypothetical protein QBC35DRAFT_503203 [Podospora australis]|uniref:ATPase AAA-type core domain-containing protein n=1 Tax=Podospora australis TaxID=1536484 RepID=A0AAN6WQJ8_9PEZI|nr:hypothetical protein QBC35DRAFT_503203 [Podospora australis]